MATQKELIAKIKEYPKFNGKFNKELTTNDFVTLEKYPDETILIKDIFPLTNKAYPSKFNLSVSEYLWSEMCKKRGLVIKKDIFDYTALPEHSFWAITRNIRDDDFDKIMKGSNQHLLLFHIVGVSGFSVTSLSIDNRRFYLSKFIEFLSKYINLSNLEVAYFPGGDINKHSLNKHFPEDINKLIYQELSDKNNFSIFPTTEETFLSLKVFGSPIYWGYRNEFFFKHKNSRIDIGTIECLPYTPKYLLKDGEIKYKDIVKNQKGFIGSGIGLERLMMIIENEDNIWDISIIKPLINLLKKEAKNKVSDRVLFFISEILKVLQYVVSETGGLTTGALGNKHRREIISKYLNSFIALIVKADLEINEKLLEKFFHLNKELNPIDQELLSNTKKIMPILFDAITEQLRLYKTSEKYKNKTDSLIKDFYN